MKSFHFNKTNLTNKIFMKVQQNHDDFSVNRMTYTEYVKNLCIFPHIHK